MRTSCDCRFPVCSPAEAPDASSFSSSSSSLASLPFQSCTPPNTEEGEGGSQFESTVHSTNSGSGGRGHRSSLTSQSSSSSSSSSPPDLPIDVNSSGVQINQRCKTGNDSSCNRRRGGSFLPSSSSTRSNSASSISASSSRSTSRWFFSPFSSSSPRPSILAKGDELCRMRTLPVNIPSSVEREEDEEERNAQTVRRISMSEVEHVPYRFVLGCNGDHAEAERRWNLTKRWRKENNVDLILNQPQFNFHTIKLYYPHWFHRLSRSGHYVYIEQPGKANMKRLLQANIDVPILARHYIFIMEYFWKRVDRREDGRLIFVLDCSHQNLLLLGQATQLFVECLNVLQSHYPERVHRVFIINATWLFRMAWNGFSNFLNPRTISKVFVLGTNYKDELSREVGLERLPIEYGGSDRTPLGKSEVETQLREHVDFVLQECRHSSITAVDYPSGLKLVDDGTSQEVRRRLKEIQTQLDAQQQLRQDEKGKDSAVGRKRT